MARAALLLLTSARPLGFVLRAAALLLAFGLLGISPPFQRAVEEPVMALDAWLTHVLLRVLGIATRLEGKVVSSSGFSIEVIPECTGVFVFLILLALTLAYPASWRARGAGILLGAVLLFALNEVRLVSLFVLGLRARPEVFHEVHLFVWQPAFILVTGLYWYAWARRSISSSGVEPPAAQPCGPR
ncbi:MAG: archaeosortase/exosortase family protein [Planctomycetes bacterium]|nr:archaeosortase/exosortase family protein [Planctomycetota bacterium]